MRTVALNVAILALLAVLGLAAAEAWLRLTVPPSSNESIFEYTLETRRYKVMRPSASVVAWGKAFRTNRLGFRDELEGAAVPAKRPGEFRIVVLGDSFTAAAGVDYADIYTTVMERRLRERFPGVKVINLAVGGYNIVQYALVLQEVALGLEPDLLLVALFPDNDFSMATYELNYRVASGREPAQPQLAWYEELYVYRAWLGRVHARLKKLVAGEEKAADDGRGWRENAAALQAIAGIAQREGLPLSVALLPHTWHFERQRPLFARVHGVCAEAKLACLDLLEPFIARKVEEASLRLNRLDAHPNAKYNALVADELAGHLARILPAPAARPVPVVRTDPLRSKS
jgi:hypothetical protein